ncbi:MAG: C40 family peptidase [Saprospiraceae bacterium]|nr:C40 family peptidase [Saprospiraceae bacterium]
MIQNNPKTIILVVFLGLLMSNCGTTGQFGITRTNKPNVPKKRTAESQTPQEKEVAFEQQIQTPEEDLISYSNLRNSMVDYAKQYIGTKYKSGGIDPKGFDCSGFTQYVMKKFDYDISRVSGSQEKEGKKVKIKHAKAGDLVFFRKSGRVFHVALVVDNQKDGLKVIHSTNRGVVVDNITKSSYWKPKLSSAVDVIGGE